MLLIDLKSKTTVRSSQDKTVVVLANGTMKIVQKNMMLNQVCPNYFIEPVPITIFAYILKLPTIFASGDFTQMSERRVSVFPQTFPLGSLT